MPSDVFYPCLEEALVKVGEERNKDLRWTTEELDNEEKSSLDVMWNKEANTQRRLSGFKSKIHARRIENASTRGVDFLNDIRRLEADYGLEGTFTYATQFLDFEMWYTFTSEMTLCLALSIVVVLGIILIITSDVTVTLLVAFCVCITDMFLFALIHYWGLTLNVILLIHIVVSIGISVDYSAHIAYAYLSETVPEEYCDSARKIRIYKAKMALRKMGSSVFHGGFSTFMAILVLSPGKTYIFLVFFRLWFGIILFGMANGFLLLPVILSIIGPTRTVTNPHFWSESDSGSSTASTTSDKKRV